MKFLPRAAGSSTVGIAFQAYSAWQSVEKGSVVPLQTSIIISSSIVHGRVLTDNSLDTFCAWSGSVICPPQGLRGIN
jgi:hypothetical protein